MRIWEYENIYWSVWKLEYLLIRVKMITLVNANIISLPLLVHCFATASCTLFRYRFLYIVSLSLLDHCFAIASWSLFRYSSLIIVSLPFLNHYFTAASWSLFRNCFLIIISMSLLDYWSLIWIVIETNAFQEAIMEWCSRSDSGMMFKER
jgi:hypothetical protein